MSKETLREFNEELLSIEWSDMANETAGVTAGVELSYLRFYKKDILNYLAPYRRIAQKEKKT